MQIKEKKPFYSLYFALFILILQAKEQSRLNDEQDRVPATKDLQDSWEDSS